MLGATPGRRMFYAVLERTREDRVPRRRARLAAVGGTAVDHRVCVVSPDGLAADRVALELMGIDFAKVGYLNYCAQARLGEADLSKIAIVGEPIASHVKTYKLSQNIQEQMIWQKPAAS